MKKILTLVLCCMVFFAGYSQVTGPTTEEEYNYASSGYKLQLQMKLPMKKGYSLADLGSSETGDRECTFKSLMRDGTKQACAVIMIYDRPRKNPEYFCIPTADAPQELWDKFYSSIKSDTENENERFRFFAYALAQALMKK